MPHFRRTKRILRSYALHLSHELIKIKTRGYNLQPRMGEVISILKSNPLPISLRKHIISKEILEDPVTYIKVSSDQAMMYGIMMKMFVWSPQTIFKIHSGINGNSFFQAVNPGLEYSINNYELSMNGVVRTDDYTFLDSMSGTHIITNTSRKETNVSFHINIDDEFFGRETLYDKNNTFMSGSMRAYTEPDIEWYALKDDRS